MQPIRESSSYLQANTRSLSPNEYLPMPYEQETPLRPAGNIKPAEI